MAKVRVEHEQGATFVELFFDLVFVYAITQLTSLVLHDLTFGGVGEALLLFWLVWWAWTQFTWTLNSADTEHVLVRLPVLAATAVAFFLAQAVPDAFGGAGAWFAVSYVAVRLIGLGLQEWVLRTSGEIEFSPLNVWTMGSLLGLVLVLAGGLSSEGVRVWFWVGAVVTDIISAELAGRGVWNMAAGHFTERHGLIVIIALGESLIAAGVATADLERDALFALTVTGAVVLTCALWWTYFGAVQAKLEHAMEAWAPEMKARGARDVFSFGHAVIVAGVIGVAVGYEEAIAHPDHGLPLAAAIALTVGFAMFVGGLAGAARRAGIDLRLGPRVGVVGLVLAATPVVPDVPPWVVLWGVSVLVAGLAIAETRGTRGRVEA